jgi:hypothetical protein
MRRSTAALLVTLPLMACAGSDRNPVTPGALPAALPPSAPAPQAAPPAPTPVTVPAAPAGDPRPQRPVNRPPTVTVRFAGDSGCHPRRVAGEVQPCTVEVVAVAADPDGDPLAYTWKGCTAGAARTAGCRVNAPALFTAAVEVSDGRGGTARGSVEVEGRNRPPSATLSPAHPPFRAGPVVEIYGGILDPDDGHVCGRQWCVRAEASGACGPAAFLDCTCLGDLYAEVRPLAAGTCTVTVTLADDWGLEGQSVLRFDVLP